MSTTKSIVTWKETSDDDNFELVYSKAELDDLLDRLTSDKEVSDINVYGIRTHQKVTSKFQLTDVRG